jgi:hypothetical protein
MRPLHPLPLPLPVTSAGPRPSAAASRAARGPATPAPRAVPCAGQAGASPVELGAPAGRHGAEPGRCERPGRPRSASRRLRCVIGVIGGVLWWGAVFRFAAGPGEAAPWLNALVAGGWGLGLIPLHAVPARASRRRTARARPADPALRTP